VSTSTAPATARAATPQGGRLARHRSTLVILLGLLAAVAVVVVLGNGTETGTPMDPDNPGPDGARALARVLADEGVEIEVARSAADLEDLTTGPSSVVVVVLPENLGQSTAERLLQHTEDAAELVVVGAGPGTTSALDLGDLPSTVSVGKGRAAGCDDPLYEGLRIEVDTAAAYPEGRCFDGDEGALVAEPRAGVVLFGADQALTNDQILRADNAAVALRLLGQKDRLVWYVPSLDDLLADDGVSLQSLLPRWIRPGLWVLLLTVAALVLWRARRLGPLATEPLPVVVRAVETTRSLGRLYRRSGDRAHAAEALRRAARARCAERLRIGSGVDLDVLVREVARRTGRPQEAVQSLLGRDSGAGPSSDRDLITLANELALLDREVRRT
jgi:hypothetical protein